MKRLALLLALVAGVTAACDPAKPYAAIVNEQEILSSTIDDELVAVTSNALYSKALDQELGSAGGLHPGGDNTVNAQYTAQLVYSRVLGTLLEQEANRLNVTPTPEHRASAEQALRNGLGDPALYESLAANYRDYLVERQARLDALITRRNTPEAQRVSYDADPGRFSQTCVRHILVESSDRAVDVRNRVAGGADFAAIANSESLDTPTQRGGQPNGGDLGCYTNAEVEDFVAPFRDALKTLQAGELSQPVQTNFGYHIVQITSKKQPAFEEAQPGISQELSNASKYFAELLARSQIKVNPRYGDYTPGDPAAGRPGRITPHPPVALEPERDESTSDAGTFGTPMQPAP